MIDYDTILSTTEGKLTLLQWLKKVEAALKDASATTFKVNKKGDATLTFSIVFADGTELESGEIILQQGESVESGAIVNGHLMLTLTNGDVLDCGELLNGNVNINGDLSVTGTIDGSLVTGDEIVEKMSGYSFTMLDRANLTKEMVYAGACKNGNKLTLVIACNFTRTGELTEGSPDFRFNIPSSVGSKLYNTAVGSMPTVLATGEANFTKNIDATTGHFNYYVSKASDTIINVFLYRSNTLPSNDKVYSRIELTFLLSENLAA